MQSVPDGYEALDFVGFTDRGEFSGTETYIENDIVHWNNTAWRCLKDNTTGITPAEGENWTVFIASETDSSGITTTDTEGLVGSAGEKVSNQDLIDAIADRVINRLLSKSAISTTQINDQEKVPSSALVFGMAEEIGELNENISKKQDASTAITTGNIGRQTVRWAEGAERSNFANSASAVSWENVSGRPHIPFQNWVWASVIPNDVNVHYTFSSDALKGKDVVIAIFNNVFLTIIVTKYAPSVAQLNVQEGGQYWGGEVEVTFDSGSGTVRFKVVWKGSSQPISNFELFRVVY